MRVPIRKAWRAHRSLDRFDDETARQILVDARFDSALEAWIGAPALLAMLNVLVWVLRGMAQECVDGLPIYPRYDAWVPILEWTSRAVAAVLVLVATLGTYNAWERHAIDQRLAYRRCSKCYYDLRGVPATTGGHEVCQIVCPECGRVTPLPPEVAELRATESPATPAPPSSL
ncbi:MAG: hypothetical protein R3B57_02245 [Phycisphaerales bacterium]